MSDNTVLVLGATGKTGRRVATRLRMSGVGVRAASRSSDTRFDWSDPDTWDAALTGVAAVYIVPPDIIGPVDDFITNAERAGVRRVVLLSGRGADTWGDSAFGQDMIAAEKAVRSSELEWTIVRANNFAQNFTEDPLFVEALAGGEVATPAGVVPEPFVDIEDVASVIVKALTTEGHSGRTYELTGPRSITFAEAVGLIAGASDRTIDYRQISVSEYADAVETTGWPRAAAEGVAAMYELMSRGLISTTTDDVAQVLGRPATPFEDYVARTASAGGWRV
ncbi:NAD(P)H-binding protein [Gordonia sp. NPDC058843]|uniref:NAD(P)H-binding protein n=1 Tax=Gordonia sp. NPDC058843 TaxID=3346648 RepID=UPI0036AD5B5F